MYLTVRMVLSLKMFQHPSNNENAESAEWCSITVFVLNQMLQCGSSATHNQSPVGLNPAISGGSTLSGLQLPFAL